MWHGMIDALKASNATGPLAECHWPFPVLVTTTARHRRKEASSFTSGPPVENGDALPSKETLDGTQIARTINDHRWWERRHTIKSGNISSFWIKFCISYAINMQDPDLIWKKSKTLPIGIEPMTSRCPVLSHNSRTLYLLSYGSTLNPRPEVWVHVCDTSLSRVDIQRSIYLKKVKRPFFIKLCPQIFHMKHEIEFCNQSTQYWGRST